MSTVPNDVIPVPTINDPVIIGSSFSFPWYSYLSRFVDYILSLQQTITATTPTPTAGTGTLTTASSSITTVKTGQIALTCGTVTITTNGTGATDIKLDLPYTAIEEAAGQWRETALTGTGGHVVIISNTSTALFFNDDGTYPGANGRTFFFSIPYIVSA